MEAANHHGATALMRAAANGRVGVHHVVAGALIWYSWHVEQADDGVDDALRVGVDRRRRRLEAPGSAVGRRLTARPGGRRAADRQPRRDDRGDAQYVRRDEPAEPRRHHDRRCACRIDVQPWPYLAPAGYFRTHQRHEHEQLGPVELCQRAVDLAQPAAQRTGSPAPRLPGAANAVWLWWRNGQRSSRQH